MANGIDVSMHNGNIDFAKVKSSGYEYVFIKATEGTTYQDPLLEQNYSRARGVNLKIGFYHFLVGTSSPETQAENFFNNIKNKVNDLKPCLDIERSGFEVMNYAIRFIERFKALSNMSICIYTSPYFANTYLDERLRNYSCWIANYGKEPWYPSSTNVWGNVYCGHQYTETGSIHGISGKVDLNVFNNNILNGGNEEEEDMDYNYNFSELYYAEKNPDVVAAYGDSREALLKHYNEFGKKEGRLPTPPTENFNEAYYLLNNPDVNANVSSGHGFASGLAHYRYIGWKENRKWTLPSYKTLDALYEFSDYYYRKKNPDVVAVYGESREALMNHYNLHGKSEGRLPTPPTEDFDEAYYLLNNPDVNEAIKNGLDWCVNGLAHYRYVGWEENRSWAKPDLNEMQQDRINKEVEKRIEEYKEKIKNEINNIL